MQTRNALLDAAKRIFGDLGYARTSHADIAAQADIGRTTFYEHFASKEDLLVQLVQRDLPALIEDIIASVDAGLAPDERLGELTVRFVEFVGTDLVAGAFTDRVDAGQAVVLHGIAVEQRLDLGAQLRVGGAFGVQEALPRGLGQLECGVKQLLDPVGSRRWHHTLGIRHPKSFRQSAALRRVQPTAGGIHLHEF